MPFVAQVAVGKREFVSIYGNDYDTPDGTGYFIFTFYLFLIYLFFDYLKFSFLLFCLILDQFD